MLVLASLFAGLAASQSAKEATVAPRTALLDRINVVRAEHGLRRVYPSTQLRGAAQRGVGLKDVAVHGLSGEHTDEPLGELIGDPVENGGVRDQRVG